MPRRDYSKVAFAATGDTHVIPTPVQPDGSISLQTGWGFDYQRNNGAGGGTPDPLAKNIDRQDMNGVLNEITASVGEIQQNGNPIWASTAAPYPVNAIVRHANINYRSAIANNNSTPGANADWVDDTFYPGRLIGIRVITATGASTYTATPGTRSVKVTLVGGGGGAGGAPLTNAGSQGLGGPGGSGATGVGYYTSGFDGATVTVGGGGLGGAGVAGSPGSASSFGGLMVAPGGVNGTSVPSITSFVQQSAAATISPTGANVFSSAGNRGTIGVVLSLTAGGIGYGGNSQLGGNIGRGGDGQLNPASSSVQVGNAGTAGICIIEEYR